MKSSLIVSKQTSKYAYTHVRLTVAHGAGRLCRNGDYPGTGVTPGSVWKIIHRVRADTTHVQALLFRCTLLPSSERRDRFTIEGGRGNMVPTYILNTVLL